MTALSFWWAATWGGIQEYLFGIRLGSGRLARRLRARSLYIAMVMENTAHWVLRQLRLPLTNAILQAGGHFTLLLPNTEETIQVLADADSILAQWAREVTGFGLKPHLARMTLAKGDLKDFGAARDELAERLGRAKRQPLRSNLLQGDGWDEDSFALDPLPVSAQDGLCDSCQRRAGVLRQLHEREVPICDACYQDAWVGQQLVRSRYLAFGTGGNGFPIQLPFGAARLVEREQDIPADAYLAVDFDGGCGELPSTPVVGRYMARFVPRAADGTVMEFDELKRHSTGRPALAYLKADVDNLGLIFLRGLHRRAADGGQSTDRHSISRVATLSRSLEMFFSGYLQHLAQQCGHVYTVYSGGDDLFFVGPWDAMLAFALRVREEFARFTCENPSWTISAGLVVVGDKTPVLLAAHEAQERLDAAKDTPGSEAWPWAPEIRAPEGVPSKNRLVALGTSLVWDDVAKALKRGRQVLAWLDDRSLAMAQIRRLLGYSETYRETFPTLRCPDGDVMGYRYAPSLAYDIRRNWTKAPTEALTWARLLTVRDSPEMPLAHFVCEYALYGARGAPEGETEP